jgi:hypothetical protein
LASVTIPGSVINIGAFAFDSCNELTNVYFTGNAPNASSTTFGSDTNATGYYLQGTTGWDVFAANTGLTVALWLPQIQANDASFGIQNNQFCFNVNWASGQVIVVEACTDLANPVWTPLQTNTLTNGAFYFRAPFQNNTSGRFYRISSP